MKFLSLEIQRLLSLFTISFILRLLYRSPWLEDWDSVQFALALNNFSIVDHQPHPPGYPLYIVLGRIFNLFLHNGTLTLTTLSVLLGALSVIPLYLLLRQIMGKWVAFLASALFLVIPIQWTLSEVALTNIPGMFFTLITALLLYRGRNSRKYLFTGSFLAGLTLGVRFAEYSILIALLALLLMARKNLADMVKSTILFLGGISLWLVPLVLDTRLMSFINAYINQINYIVAHDSSLSDFKILGRLSHIWELFIAGFTIYFIPVLILIAFYLIKNYKTIKEWKHLFIFTWILSYLIPLLFIYNLEFPRHLLPLLPPLVILFGLALEHLMKKYLVILGYSGVIILLWIISLSQVQKIHNLIPPTIAPVLYVKENLNPQDTLLLTTFTYRQFQYYAPEFRNYYGSSGIEKVNVKYVIIDFLQLKDKTPALNIYNVADAKEFSGPEYIFPRISKTNLYILKNNS